MGLKADMAEKCRRVLRGGNDGKQVVAAQDKIPIGDKDFVAPFDRADEHVAVGVSRDMADLHAVQPKLGTDAEFKKLHAPLCKGVDLDRGGKAQKPRNLSGCGQLRVDDHGNAELDLDEIQLVVVNRIADSGDRVAVAGFFGDQAAEKI